MKFTRSTPPVIVCTLALAIGAMAGCTRSEPVASDTLPTVPDSLVEANPAPTTVPPTTTPVTTQATPPPMTASPTEPPNTPAPRNPEPTAPPVTPAPTPAPPTAPPNEPPTGGGDQVGDNGNTTTRAMDAEAIITVLGTDPSSVDVLAWGDVDGDGDDDAVVMVTECGASCGSELMLVIDDNATPTVAPSGIQGPFGPWYNGGGASPSSIHSAVITPGIVTLVGSLCGNLPESGNDAPGTCNPLTQRTAIYQFTNGTLAPVSINPPVG